MIRMDDDGNVLIKRTGKTEVSFLAAVDTGDRRQANRLGRNQGHLLETDRTVALFDMNKFQRIMANNIMQGRREKREMELQVCIIVAISGGTDYSITVCVNSCFCSRCPYLARPALLDNCDKYGHTGHAQVQHGSSPR